MAKFCTKCGKPLEDGKPCDCINKTVVTEVGDVTLDNNVGFDISKYINTYIEILKGIFIKPVDTIKRYATSNQFILAIIAIVLNSVIFGIFGYCLINESSSGLFSLMGLGDVGSLTGMGFEVPFMRVFLYGMVFMLVWLVVVALMIYLLAGAILKDKIDIKQAFALVGVVSVFTTITNIISILLVYISIKIMIVVLLVALVFYLIYLYQGLADITKIDRNKLSYIFVPSVSVATFVMIYILPKILF